MIEIPMVSWFTTLIYPNLSFGKTNRAIGWESEKMDKEARVVLRAAIPDALAFAVLGISVFGLLATIGDDYLVSEAGGNPWYNLQGATALNNLLQTVWNIHWALFRPFFPMGLFLVIPFLDAFALIYFVLLMVSLTVIWRKKGRLQVLKRLATAGSSIMLVFEVGLTLVSPGFLGMHVTNFQYELGLGWFSNQDLLIISAAATGAFLAARLANFKLHQHSIS